MPSNSSAADLPFHLLVLIFSRLLAADFIRCGSVCQSWRKATAENPHRSPTTEIPYLLLPGTNKGFGRLFSLSTKKISRLPSMGGRRCLGSSDGWVVTIDDLAELHILNPFTGIESPLPSITTIYSAIKGVEFYADTDQIAGYIYDTGGDRSNPEFHDLKHMRKYFYEKVIFFPSAMTAVAIHGAWRSLVFARFGDTSWTELDPIYWSHDFILHKGHLFAVTYGGYVSKFDLGDPSTSHRLYPGILEWDRHYLVETQDGDLLQVCRESSYIVTLHRGFPVRRGSPKAYTGQRRTKYFKIFKLEPDGVRVEVTSLGEKTAIFIGHNHSVSIPTRDSPLKDNCIYFTDDSLGDYMPIPRSKRDMGVFNMEDGSIESFFPKKSALDRLSWPPPVWITPALS